MTTAAPAAEKVEAMSDRTIGYLSGACVSAMVYLGDQLGLYRELRGAGQMTSTELASRSRLDERWVREWLLTNAIFHLAPASTLGPAATFDSVLTRDCLHDMTDPAGAMRSIRAAIKPDGTWLIIDINGMPTPKENYGHPLSGLLYAISVLDCLACSTCEEGGAGLGTLDLTRRQPLPRSRSASASRRAKCSGTEISRPMTLGLYPCSQ